MLFSQAVAQELWIFVWTDIHVVNDVIDVGIKSGLVFLLKKDKLMKLLPDCVIRKIE